MSKYKVLFIDDDEDYANSLMDKVYDNYSMVMDYLPDWENGREKLLRSHANYDGIIIDAMGKLTSDATDPSFSALTSIVRELDSLVKKNIILPYLINTAHSEKVEEWYKDVRVFNKGNEDQMLRYLIGLIDEFPDYRIRIKHALVMQAFGRQRIADDSKLDLMNVLKYLEKQEEKDLTEKFTTLRKVMEAMVESLIDHGIVDKRCRRKNETDIIKWSVDYLDGKYVSPQYKDAFKADAAITPKHINQAMLFVHNTASTCSHKYSEANTITPYALRSVCDSLCEILSWYVRFMKEKKR